MYQAQQRAHCQVHAGAALATFACMGCTVMCILLHAQQFWSSARLDRHLSSFEHVGRAKTPNKACSNEREGRQRTATDAFFCYVQAGGPTRPREVCNSHQACVSSCQQNAAQRCVIPALGVQAAIVIADAIRCTLPKATERAIAVCKLDLGVHLPPMNRAPLPGGHGVDVVPPVCWHLEAHDDTATRGCCVNVEALVQ